MVYSRTETKKEHLPLWRRLNISELGIRIVLLAVIVGGGLSYLVLTSTVATRGLEAKDLTDRLDSLSTKHSTLQAEVDRLQSMARLETAKQDLNLVDVAQVDYVTSTTGAVAAR